MADADGATAASRVDAAITAAARPGAPRRAVAAAGAAVAIAAAVAWRSNGTREGPADAGLDPDDSANISHEPDFSFRLRDYGYFQMNPILRPSR